MEDVIGIFLYFLMALAIYYMIFIYPTNPPLGLSMMWMFKSVDGMIEKLDDSNYFYIAPKVHKDICSLSDMMKVVRLELKGGRCYAEGEELLSNTVKTGFIYNKLNECVSSGSKDECNDWKVLAVYFEFLNRTVDSISEIYEDHYPTNKFESRGHIRIYNKLLSNNIRFYFSKQRYDLQNRFRKLIERQACRNRYVKEYNLTCVEEEGRYYIKTIEGNLALVSMDGGTQYTQDCQPNEEGLRPDYCIAIKYSNDFMNKFSSFVNDPIYFIIRGYPDVNRFDISKGHERFFIDNAVSEEFYFVTGKELTFGFGGVQLVPTKDGNGTVFIWDRYCLENDIKTEEYVNRCYYNRIFRKLLVESGYYDIMEQVPTAGIDCYKFGDIDNELRRKSRYSVYANSLCPWW